jgi:hypothetical protein
MKAKVALIDHEVGPDFCDQFLLANYFGRAFDESDKNVDSTAAKPNANAAFFQDPFRDGQTKRAEADHIPRNRPSKLRICDIHSVSPEVSDAQRISGPN